MPEREVSNRGAFRGKTNFGFADQVSDDFDVVKDHNLIRSISVRFGVRRLKEYQLSMS